MENSIYISSGSLIVATVALFITVKKDRKKSISDKKALIRAKGYKSVNSWIVWIWNDGEATAKNIRIESSDIEKDNGIQLRIEKGKIPYPLFHTGGSFDINAFSEETHKPVVIVKFIWDDDYTNNNEREIVLNF